MAKSIKQLTIAVLMGGTSAEREISLITGRAVVTALKSRGIEPLELELDSDTPARLAEEGVDFVFLALHGTLGEDGRVQGLLDVLGIPYSGSGVLGSALGMNKLAAKRMFNALSIPTPAFQVWQKGEPWPDISSLGFPVVVKPLNQGSAVGVTIVKNAEHLEEALNAASDYGQVLLEEYVEGTELSVGVLGDTALPVIEIIPRGEFYDYDSKYSPCGSEHIIPARISERLTKLTKAMALRAHDVLFCEDYSRVDMILKGDRLFLLEVNTLPGLTGVSLFPDAARVAGIDFPELIERLVRLGLKKNKFCSNMVAL